MWATLDLSPVAISQNMDLAVNLPDNNSNVFSENMGHPQPVKIITIIKCPKLLSIYGGQAEIPIEEKNIPNLENVFWFHTYGYNNHILIAQQYSNLVTICKQIVDSSHQ